MKLIRESVNEFIGKECVYMSPKNRENLQKYNEKIAKVIDYDGEEFLTLEFIDPKGKITYVPLRNVRFIK